MRKSLKIAKDLLIAVTLMGSTGECTTTDSNGYICGPTDFNLFPPGGLVNGSAIERECHKIGGSAVAGIEPVEESGSAVGGFQPMALLGPLSSHIPIQPDAVPVASLNMPSAVIAKRGQMLSALLQGISPRNPEQRSGLWVTGYGTFGDIDSTALSEGADFKSYGALAGARLRLSPNLSAGLAVGVSKADVTPNSNLGDGTQESIDLAAQLTYASGPLTLAGTVVVSFEDYDSSRTFDVSGLSRTAAANAKGTALSARLEGIYQIDLGAVSLMPTAKLDYIQFRRGGFTEDGAGLFNLVAERTSLTAIPMRLGASMGMSGQREASFRPYVGAFWMHDLGELEREMSVAYANMPGSDFQLFGVTGAKNALEFNAGFDYRLSDRIGFNIGYEGQISARHKLHGIRGRMSIAW